MRIQLAETAGFCHGVNRAVEMCRRAAARYDNCVTIGPVIHNKFVIEELEKLGVRTVEDISEITPGDTVIIRSHGACRYEYEALQAQGNRIIDATCPDVKKIHDIVRRDSLTGRKILVIGQREHPEIKAICSWCSQYEVFETEDELENRLDFAQNTQIPVSIVFQTTNIMSHFVTITEKIKKMCTNQIIYDTVCNATFRRQCEAQELAEITDAVIVIGDKNSSNSLKLAQICNEHSSSVYFIQSAGDIDPQEFGRFRTVGITAGASTPAFIIKEVIAKMSTESMDPIEETTENASIQQEEPATDVPTESTAEDISEETSAPETVPAPQNDEPAQPVADDEPESFEEMLEKSIKTLRTGDKVSGIVTSITATEISVDLGTKQSGYIPISEFTDDENTDINEIIKVGDTIEAFIIRVNDVEGMIMLSKKRLDAIKNWDVITAAKESREVVHGFVIQENRGGIVVNVKGVHVFVPASQTGLSKSEPMSELLKKNVKLRINEVNQSRRRVIGSIRDAQKDERREKSEKLWNEIEIGKKYTGIVKSMTSYGVFVDIGGVDGMIHISELSWTRIKQPSEVMSVGDEISVYIISFDKESRKISLGYKKGEDNPWTKFTSDYSVDDVISVKIVKMMPFGAFAEICPGIDGLIHISQIAEHRIGLPSEVLSEGQTVDVKITEIDNERKKVSLSIKALIEPKEKPEDEEPAAAEEPPAESPPGEEPAAEDAEEPAATKDPAAEEPTAEASPAEEPAVEAAEEPAPTEEPAATEEPPAEAPPANEGN